jgi:hypothetical protein
MRGGEMLGEYACKVAIVLRNPGFFDAALTQSGSRLILLPSRLPVVNWTT